MEDIKDTLLEEEVQETEAKKEDSAATGTAASEAVNDEELTMKDFEVEKLWDGKRITGEILEVADDRLTVNIRYKSDGIVPIEEVFIEPGLRLGDIFKAGDKIEVEVLKVRDDEGNVLLSHRKVAKERVWKDIEQAYKAQTEVIGVGKEVIKGGILADVNGVQAFVPASQLSTHYVDNLNAFINQNLRLKILEVDKKRNRIVASQRVVLEAEEEERRRQVWDNIQEGQKVKGEVKRLTKFGAFVDLGGVDGLIHISDLSWGHIKNPGQVVQEGQQVEAVVLSVDKENNRISLGYKQTIPHPWEDIDQKYPVGSIVEGKVVRLTDFGAFVELEPGVDGLVHISQISSERVNKVSDVLKTGDIVKAKVMEVKPKEQRISLSIREALAEEKPVEQAEEQEQEVEQMTVSLGEFFPDQGNE
ncbi:MAG TPA: 30S ribosomal protein S1 [Candidatus Atribacteria bacterium]|nr:30S ribosomal protein S1 [Candidatus Atribacteria bacterium]HPT79457.1 30S ribosomal protein S1 [Candidatus Atribacteria bacterium]